MTSGISNVYNERTRLQRSRVLEGKLVNAATKKPSGLSQSSGESCPGDPIRDVPATKKRRLNAAHEVEPLPIKRPRLIRTRAQRPVVADDEVEQASKTIPEQRRTKRKYRYLSPLQPKTKGLEQAIKPHQLQERQIGGGNSELQSQRKQLTRENLARFNKMVNTRGVNKALASAPGESATGSSTTDTSSTPKTISTTRSGFARQASKNGILHRISSKAPTNLQALRKEYANRRRSASPTQSEHNRYDNAVTKAVNETTMVNRAGGMLLKNHDDEHYGIAFNQAFTGFPEDVGFNHGLSTPKPDFVEGLEMGEFDPFPIDEHVDGAVLHKDNPFSLTLPHIAGEWKGVGKDMEKARQQSAYDGAALVYARNQALSYLGTSDPPGHAQVATFTTDGTNLNLYAHYASLNEDGVPKYHQYRIKSTNLIDSYEGFKEGRRALRNAQEYAKKQSYALRNQLKDGWKQRRNGLHPMADGTPPVPELGLPGATNLSENAEDEAGYVLVEQPSEPTPPTSLKLNHFLKDGKSSITRSLRSTSVSTVHAAARQHLRRKASSRASIHQSSRQRSTRNSD